MKEAPCAEIVLPGGADLMKIVIEVDARALHAAIVVACTSLLAAARALFSE